MTRLYLAGPYSARETLKGYRAEATRIGYEVRARWLDGTHEVDSNVVLEATATDKQRGEWAQDDLEDIRACDLLVAFTATAFSGGASGGRHVETGYALGQHKTVILVGKPENVFHWLPGITRVADWHEALIELAARAAQVRRPRASDS